VSALLLSVLQVPYFAGVGLYGLALLLTSLFLAGRQRRPALLPLLPLVFLAIHGGAGYGVLREWLAPAASFRP
jgi:hypothetical protein